MTADGGIISHEITGDEVVAGQSDAPRFEEVYRSHWRELCVYLNKAFGPGPPDPEDVAQAAFVKFASLEDPGRVKNARAFLFTTARNIVMDEKRHENVVERLIDDVLLATGQESLSELSPERVIIEKERFALLEKVVRRLPPKQQTVLVLNRVHGCTHEEISRKTGWSRPNVSKHVREAAATIKAEFEKADRIKRGSR